MIAAVRWVWRKLGRCGRVLCAPNDARLTPGYVLSLPGPVIIYGQDWCHDGGDDYYRLGYVVCEHWSGPRLTGQVT